MTDIVYEASPTLKTFHKDDNFVRAIMGPIGSGKSVACCWEIMFRAMAQEPHTDGVRRSRWVIIRNTYRELIDTTMLTFFDWFPKDMGDYKAGDMKWTLFRKLEDGTSIYLEVLFRALDKPDDIKKLLSLELTGGWLNEAREIPKQVLDMLVGRLGRYPSKRLGGPSWFGCIADTNPPDSDHWWYRLFEENCPDNYSIYHQPGGTDDDAENIDNLPPLYYHNMQSGKDPEWVNVYVHGKYGFISDGKPIYPEFNDTIHTTQTEIKILEDVDHYIGIDFGRTPSATFFQEVNGQYQVYDELVTEGMGATTFATLLNKKINGEYPTIDYQIYGDPAGEHATEVSDDTPFLVLNAAGIMAIPAYTNDYTIRREAVANCLTRLNMVGQPCVLLGPKAVMLRKGMNGGYKFKRLQVSGEERFQDKPDKNKYSHVCESFQYGMLGTGEGGKVVGADTWDTSLDYSKLNRAVI